VLDSEAEFFRYLLSHTQTAGAQAKTDQKTSIRGDSRPKYSSTQEGE